MRFGLTIVALWLTACSHTSNFHEFESSMRTNLEAMQPTITPPEILEDPFNRQTFNESNIFELSESHRNDFLSFYYDPQNRNIKPYLRVAQYIEQNTLNFTYKGETFTASQSFTSQSGNCLSLAILSTAIAELAELPFKYKKVHSAPIFSENGDVQTVSSHINLTLYDTTKNSEMKLLMPASVVIDYFKTGHSVTASTITKDEVLIMFWHNLASEAIAQSNLHLAFSYTMMANDINPLHPETLNLLAILYGRTGNSEKAFEVYDFLDNNQIYSFTVLDNFAAMLHKKGEFKRAEALWEKVKHINDDNPYTWLTAAKKQIQYQNYTLAERYLLTSLELAPYLHEVHFNLAKVYAQNSNESDVRNSLNIAMSLASMPEDQRRYQAKLYGLDK